VEQGRGTATASIAAKGDGGIAIVLLGLALGAIAGSFAIVTGRRRRVRSAR
jgi:hypothetical protein